jgi:hypothetical protein
MQFAKIKNMGQPPPDFSAVIRGEENNFIPDTIFFSSHFSKTLHDNHVHFLRRLYITMMMRGRKKITMEEIKGVKRKRRRNPKSNMLRLIIKKFFTTMGLKAVTLLAIVSMIFRLKILLLYSNIVNFDD